MPVPPSSSARERADAILPRLEGTKEIAILGGSFNPPHVGHALLALAILATQDPDELWILPVADHPFGKDSAAFEHRIAMCKLAFGRLPQVRVLELEDVMDRPNYTVKTLRMIRELRPNLNLSLIIGSDILPELDRWSEPSQLPNLARIIAVPRQGAPEMKPAVDIPLQIYKGFTLPMVSSSQIVASLRKSADVEGLLDLRVLEYIRSAGLYKPQSA
ncbi:nicotinate (nicotinamide) nucleotide adenylyltransferase [Microvenator marinus]|uniref:nicotinate (nicotinamide) nucleotide adenylyltransferase n=1 Tax=Microvenator marinus TaxID=2600177 RepID=UPI00201B4A4D|nr:nicotinate (nicotinamide) nucleotide adenylyltransferase [Microvenator marinus]